MVMTVAEDMKKMTENIIISNDVRLKAVGDIVADTHKTLSGFAADRKKMAAQQANDLAGFTSGLSKDVKGMLKDAQNMVKEFHKNNRQMSQEQAKKLSDFVNGLSNEVGSMLDGFHKDRKTMAKELKNKLGMEIKDIQKQVGNILDEADKFVGECRSDMAQARKAWKDMCAALAKARKGGFAMPEVNAGQKVTTAKQAARKAQGKKKTASKPKAKKKSVSKKRKVHAGV